MPKRPREHVLEEESRKEFGHLLPNHWVIRKPDPDYGIDAEVEVFSDDGSPTGLIFYVQLKATDKEGLSKALKVSFKKGTIEYYHKLKIPVLIARYHAPTKQFFIRWAHSIDLYYSSQDAESYTVKFLESSRWKKESPELIKTYLERLRDLEKILPLPIAFSLQLDAQFSNNTYPIKLESRIRELIKSQNLPIRLTIEDLTELSAKIIVAPTEIKISILDKTGFTMHNVQSEDGKYNESCLPFDILSSIGCFFFVTGRRIIAFQILTDNLPHSALIESTGFLSLLSSFIGSEKSFHTVIRLMENLLKTNRPDKVGITNNIFMTVFAPGHLKFGCPKSLQRNLADIMLTLCNEMELAGDMEAAGITYYNLGNAMRRSSFFTERQVISWYIKAARLCKAYLNRDYYWAEFGGLLFHSDKFLCSSKFYKKALTIKEKPWTMGLCADALLFTGRYSESLSCYQDFLRKEKNPNTEMFLKAGLVESFIESTNIKKQHRMEEKAFSLATINLKDAMSCKETAMTAISKLEKIYNVDLLCPMMWAHLATLYNYIGEISQAFHAALATCLLEPKNLKAWVVCIMLGAQIKSQIIGAVVFLAYEKNGEELFEFFMHDIEMIGNDLDAETAAMLKSLFDGIRSHHEAHGRDDYSVVRVFHDDDSYEEIKLNNI